MKVSWDYYSIYYGKKFQTTNQIITVSLGSILGLLDYSDNPLLLRYDWTILY